MVYTPKVQSFWCFSWMPQQLRSPSWQAQKPNVSQHCFYTHMVSLFHSQLCSICYLVSIKWSCPDYIQPWTSGISIQMSGIALFSDTQPHRFLLQLLPSMICLLSSALQPLYNTESWVMVGLNCLSFPSLRNFSFVLPEYSCLIQLVQFYSCY